MIKEFLARYISSKIFFSARLFQFLPDINCHGWLFGLFAYCCFAFGLFMLLLLLFSGGFCFVVFCWFFFPILKAISEELVSNICFIERG